MSGKVFVKPKVDDKAWTLLKYYEGFKTTHH